MGCRGDSDNAANTATTPIAEYYGVMMAQDTGVENSPAQPPCSAPTPPSAATARPSSRPRTSATKARAASGTTSRRPTTASRRAPTTPGSATATSTLRDLRPRTDQALLESTGSNRISNTDPAHSKWSAYCSIYFTDEDADGRQDSSEVCPRQRQGGRHAPAQGDLLRRPRDAEREARPAHPRPLDLPATQPDGSKTVKTDLRRRQHRVGRTLRQRQVRRRQLQARERLDLRLPRQSPSRPAASRPSARTAARSSPSRN